MTDYVDGHGDVHTVNEKEAKQWTVWYSIKDWFKNLFESEAEAVLDTFDNNQPPDVGFQPYTGDDNDGDEG